MLGFLVLLAAAAQMMGHGFMVTYGLESPFVSILIASIDFVLAYGVWRGMRLAWYSSLGFSSLGIIAAVFALFLRPRTGELVSLVVDLVIAYLLIQPGVQRYFAISSAQLTPRDMPPANAGVTRTQ